MPSATPAIPPALQTLQQALEPFYARLAAHPLYRSIQTLEDLQHFMQSHVFAVWDFMSLLKSLQRGLTSVDVPWLPSPHPIARRLVNEIVLGEESDLYNGEPVSHFELYLRAMQHAGAPTTAIDTLTTSLRAGTPVDVALAAPTLPAPARDFLQSTFQVIATGELHRIAAAFTFGREDLIPDLFTAFIRDQDAQLSGALALFRWYLDRHIEVDGEEHGPMALQMIASLCGDSPTLWHEAEQAAIAAIQARLALWDGILAGLPSR